MRVNLVVQLPGYPVKNKFIYVGINVLDSHFHGNDREEYGNDRRELGNDREDRGNDREEYGNDREGGKKGRMINGLTMVFR